MYNVFLFDLDGTLVRMKLDFGKMQSDLTDLIGKTEGSLLESISKIQDSVLKVRAFEYVQEEERKAAENSELIDGSIECLQYLKERNIKIGIITRNNRESCMKSVKKTDIETYIDVIISRDDVERVKPDKMHIEAALERMGTGPKECVVVGDHHFEIEAGRTLGCMTVGLLSGSGTKKTLKHADLLFDSIKEFYEDWVRRKI